MRAQPRHRKSVWRSGFLILGLYGLLLQGFFAGAAGMGLPARAGLDPHGAALCLTLAEDGALAPASGEAPLHGAGHDCVCPALCHGGSLFAPPAGALGAAQRASVTLAARPASAQPSFSALHQRPPARAPPHDDAVPFA
jgi:hypothetical protein